MFQMKVLDLDEISVLHTAQFFVYELFFDKFIKVQFVFHVKCGLLSIVCLNQIFPSVLNCQCVYISCTFPNNR
jgi:hypothetical protein